MVLLLHLGSKSEQIAGSVCRSFGLKSAGRSADSTCVRFPPAEFRRLSSPLNKKSEEELEMYSREPNPGSY